MKSSSVAAKWWTELLLPSPTFTKEEQELFRVQLTASIAHSLRTSGQAWVDTYGSACAYAAWRVSDALHDKVLSNWPKKYTHKYGPFAGMLVTDNEIVLRRSEDYEPPVSVVLWRS